MEVLKEKFIDLERRVSKLESYRDSDFAIINRHNENLATIVSDLKNITTQLATITNNWKEAINRSNAKQQEEHANINNRINILEKAVDKLTAKQESDNDKLEQTIDDRTINKNSDNYDKIKATIISVIVTAIVTALITAVITMTK